MSSGRSVYCVICPSRFNSSQGWGGGVVGQWGRAEGKSLCHSRALARASRSIILSPASLFLPLYYNVKTEVATQTRRAGILSSPKERSKPIRFFFFFFFCCSSLSGKNMKSSLSFIPFWMAVDVPCPSYVTSARDFSGFGTFKGTKNQTNIMKKRSLILIQSSESKIFLPSLMCLLKVMVNCSINRHWTIYSQCMLFIICLVG